MAGALGNLGSLAARVYVGGAADAECLGAARAYAAATYVSGAAGCRVGLATICQRAGGPVGHGVRDRCEGQEGEALARHNCPHQASGEPTWRGEAHVDRARGGPAASCHGCLRGSSKLQRRLPQQSLQSWRGHTLHQGDHPIHRVLHGLRGADGCSG